MPSLITPEHKPSPHSSRHHSQGAQHMLSKCMPGSAEGIMGGSSHQNSLESLTRPGQHSSQPCHHPGDNQTLGMEPISEVTQK